MKTLEQRLEEYIGSSWELDDFGDWNYEGEDADGEPTWQVSQICGEYVVTYILGWYEQRGEARTVEELLMLMRAMEKASDALNAYLKDSNA